MIRKAVIASLGFAMGVCAFVKTQSVTKEMFEPIIEACKLPYDEFVQSEYHPYEAKLGGTFVCLITQFLHELVRSGVPGLLSWGSIITTSLPLGVLMNCEAGREGSKGPIRYPTLLGMLGQLLGISVVFPAIWLPAYCFGGGNGAVSVSRAKMSLLLVFPAALLTLMLFNLDLRSYAWTVSAAALGGPLVAMMPLLLYLIKQPKTDEANRGAKAMADAYTVTGAAAFVAWLNLLQAAFQQYGTDIHKIATELWFEATPAVAFMTIDSVVLFLGAILYLATSSIHQALQTLLISPLVGPGAACAYTMRKQQILMAHPTKSKLT